MQQPPSATRAFYGHLRPDGEALVDQVLQQTAPDDAATAPAGTPGFKPQEYTPEEIDALLTWDEDEAPDPVAARALGDLYLAPDPSQKKEKPPPPPPAEAAATTYDDAEIKKALGTMENPPPGLEPQQLELWEKLGKPAWSDPGPDTTDPADIRRALGITDDNDPIDKLGGPRGPRRLMEGGMVVADDEEEQIKLALPSWLDVNNLADWTPEPPPPPPAAPAYATAEELVDGVAPPFGLKRAFKPLPERWLDGVHWTLPRVGGGGGGQWGRSSRTADAAVANALPELLADTDPENETVTVVAVGEALARTLEKRFPAVNVIDLADAAEVDAFDAPVHCVVAGAGALADAALGLAFRKGARFAVASGVAEDAELPPPAEDNPICADAAAPRSEWLAKQMAGGTLTYAALVAAGQGGGDVATRARTVVALDRLCAWGERDAKQCHVVGRLLATDRKLTDSVLVSCRPYAIEKRFERVAV